MNVDKVADAVFKGVESRIEKAVAPLLERMNGIDKPAILKEILGGDEIRTLVDMEVSASLEELEATAIPAFVKELTGLFNADED